MERRQIDHKSSLNMQPIRLGPTPVADPDWVLDATDGVFSGTTAKGDRYVAGDLTRTRMPGFGANVTLTLTDAANNELRLQARVFGKDQFGENINELFPYFGALAGLQVGAKVFSEITSVEFEDLAAAARVTILTTNTLTFYAKTPGTAGNSITVALIDPADTSIPISVAVTDTDIVVTLATNESDELTSTLTQVKAAIDADPEASELVDVVIGGTASTVAAAVSETALANGAAAGTGTSSDNLIVGFGNKRALPYPIDALNQVVAAFRCAGGSTGLVDLDEDAFDLTYHALKGDSANGAGSNSGVFAATDQFEILMRFDPRYHRENIIANSANNT